MNEGVEMGSVVKAGEGQKARFSRLSTHPHKKSSWQKWGLSALMWCCVHHEFCFSIIYTSTASYMPQTVTLDNTVILGVR